MSWLKKRAEEAAKEYHQPEDPDAVEDKIERVAREYAERAIKSFCNYDNIASGNGLRAVNEAIAEALATADEE